MPITALVLFSALAAAQTGGGIPGFKLWKASQLKSMGASMKTSGPLKTAGESLGRFGHYSVSMSKREADGGAEFHQQVTDFFMVVTGEATLIVGGKIKSPHTTEPGEIRGPSIEGGERHTISPGDVVHIPPGVPHQLLAPKDFTYFVIKVDSR
ncbi:MAG: cupin domain-containing protein [Bryobacterales bacterium]|nr:cupin domain-containing protein [Bryobacterales bacterium]